MTSTSSCTPRLRQILLIAKREATRCSSRLIEPEHHLLAILAHHGTATLILQQAGLTHEIADAFLHETAVTPSPPPVEMLSERSVELLKRASEIARIAGERLVWTQHLLLALFLEPCGKVADLFKYRNISHKSITTNLEYWRDEERTKLQRLLEAFGLVAARIPGPESKENPSAFSTLSPT